MRPQPGQAPPAPQSGASVHWVGPPARVEAGESHYRTFQSHDTVFSLGDHVYLQPAEPGVPLYIARVVDLFETPPPTTGPAAAAAAAGGSGAGAPPGARMFAEVSWLFRPQELDLDGPLAVDENELFAADERAVHSLESVCGRCRVVRPGQRWAGEADTFVCGRKYIPAEGRVVPLEGVQPETLDRHKPLLLVNGQLHPNTARAAPAAPRHPPPRPAPRGASKRRRREREQYSPEAGGAARLHHTAAGPPPAGPAGPSPPRSGPTASLSTSAGTAGTAAGSAGPPASGGGAAAPAAPAGTAAPSAGTPRSRPSRETHTHGRWSKERYDAAQRSLVAILRAMGATSPDKAVLRPRLREEGRKCIGDTGLLDHCLKHLADMVVSAEGERLRRRHNREGHMIYFLQHPDKEAEEEEMLREEMGALSSELREVREARHVLAAVRTEAAQAIQAVSGLKEHPEEAARELAAAGAKAPAAAEVAVRVAGLEQSVVYIQRRLYDAESLAASEAEAVRGEVAAGGEVAAAQVAALAGAAAALEARCGELERQAAVAAEESAGRYEALAAALQDSGSLRQALESRDAVIRGLQAEVAAMRQGLAAVLGAGAAAPTAVRPPGAPPGATPGVRPPAAWTLATPTGKQGSGRQPQTPPDFEAAVQALQGAAAVPWPSISGGGAPPGPTSGAVLLGSPAQAAPSPAFVHTVPAAATAGDAGVGAHPCTVVTTGGAAAARSAVGASGDAAHAQRHEAGPAEEERQPV